MENESDVCERTVFDRLVRERRSVRGFKKDPVARVLIEQALKVAQHSPSNCNAQPWRVFVAAGERCEELRRRLLAAFDQEHPVAELPTPAFEGVHRARQVACAVELYSKMGVERADKQGRRAAERRNFELFGAPQAAIICMDSSFGVGVALDVGCYLQTLMLALSARGIQSCAQASLRCYPDILRQELGIPSQLRILCGLSFGYEATDVAANKVRQTRAPIDETCTLLGF